MKYPVKLTILMALLIGAIFVSSCNRNYYSGNGKGKNCGCPNQP